MPVTDSLATRDRLDALIRPQSVAIVGASGEPTRISGVIVRILLRYGFPGPVYPVNPKYEQICGLRCYPDIGAIPADHPIDLAIIFVPRSQVVEMARQCGERGVKSLVVITSGFSEIGAAGVALQQELERTARGYGMAMAGPNCAGIANLTADFVAYGTTNFIELGDIIKGGVALLTASGGFGNTIFTYCQERAVGVSHIIGLGNEAVTDAAQFLDVLVDDPAVTMVLAHLESVRDPASFFHAADRAAALGKPLVVLKGGRSAVGRHAIATHTAALGGSPAAFAGAFRQHGVVQVTDLDELADAAALLARGVQIGGDRIGILSLAGGGTGLLADIAADYGFTVPELAPATVAGLGEILPAIAVVKNPLDPTAGFARDGAGFRAALLRFAADPGIDAVVFFPLASQPSYAEQLAASLIAAAADLSKPVIVIWTASQNLALGAWRMLHESGVPLFTSSTAAFRAMRRAREYWEFTRSRALLAASDFGPLRTMTIDGGRVGDRAFAVESLASLGLRFPPSHIARSAAEAAAAVTELGPAAMKVLSPDILHKTEAGAIQLDITSPDTAAEAFGQILDRCRQHSPDAAIDGVEVQQMVPAGLEMLLGVTTDDQLGPVLTVGLGGIFTELLRDVAQRPVPISRLDARLMLRELRASAVLDGVRGAPAYDEDRVVDAMLSLSAFADAVRDRGPEIEINPLVVHPRGRGAVAVDIVAAFTGESGARL
jgi:acyl-CoA synthetase (NDP forming)